jgi:hypothetical protein
VSADLATAPPGSSSARIGGTGGRATEQPGPGGDRGSRSARGREQARRWRAPAAVVAAVLLAAAIGLLVRPGTGGRLDPDAASPTGARALAHVLRDHGVDVRVRQRLADVQRDVDARPGEVTVLLARPDLAAPGRVAELGHLAASDRADLVMVAAGNGELSDLDLPVGASDSGDVLDVGLLAPRCSADPPSRAGDARLGGTSYDLRPDAGAGLRSVAACYPLDGRPTYVQLVHDDGRRTTLLGSGAALTNERLAEAGDAALAVGTLGRQPVLVWWVPDPLEDAGTGAPRSLTSLLPDGVRYGVLQLLVVLGVVVLWRGRRLGRLVTEPLPVVVRAIETTLGRGQLYRRARARGRAAAVLRVATTRRIAERCGLPATAPVEAVVAAAARATGRSTQQVATLLVGPDPTDDPQLTLLARDLDTLETEVLRS